MNCFWGLREVPEEGQLTWMNLIYVVHGKVVGLLAARGHIFQQGAMFRVTCCPQNRVVKDRCLAVYLKTNLLCSPD